MTKMKEVIARYTTVKNNQMVFELRKEEFVAKGIPERYYQSLSNLTQFMFLATSLRLACD